MRPQKTAALPRFLAMPRMPHFIGLFTHLTILGRPSSNDLIDPDGVFQENIRRDEVWNS